MREGALVAVLGNNFVSDLSAALVKQAYIDKRIRPISNVALWRTLFQGRTDMVNATAKVVDAAAARALSQQKTVVRLIDRPCTRICCTVDGIAGTLDEAPCGFPVLYSVATDAPLICTAQVTRNLGPA